MENSKQLLLVEGTWQTSEFWDQALPEFERRGYAVHAPGLRFHDLPLSEGAGKIAPLSLLDYTQDYVAYAKTLKSPPLIIGHSLGGLIAQLVAARTQHVGLVAACTAPAAGTFIYYPQVIKTFASYFLKPRPWNKPMLPTWEKYRAAGASMQPEAEAKARFAGLVAESGRAYCEMVFPQLDRRQAARVDYKAIEAPVLVLAGQFDKIIHPHFSKTTASKHQNAKLATIPNSDHMMFFGDALPKALAEIDHWVEENRIFG